MIRTVVSAKLAYYIWTVARPAALHDRTATWPTPKYRASQERSCTKLGACFFASAILFGTCNSMLQKSVLQVYAETRDGGIHRFTATPLLSAWAIFSRVAVATVMLRLEGAPPVSMSNVRAVMPTAALEVVSSTFSVISLRYGSPTIKRNQASFAFVYSSSRENSCDHNCCAGFSQLRTSRSFV